MLSPGPTSIQRSISHQDSILPVGRSSPEVSILPNERISFQRPMTFQRHISTQGRISPNELITKQEDIFTQRTTLPEDSFHPFGVPPQGPIPSQQCNPPHPQSPPQGSILPQVPMSFSGPISIQGNMSNQVHNTHMLLQERISPGGPPSTQDRILTQEPSVNPVSISPQRSISFEESIHPLGVPS